MVVASHKPKLVRAVLLGLLISPYFVNLSGPSLWDSTEAFYAETPREMMELESFVVPYFNYEPRLNKPPLSYWLTLPFYYAFGPSHVSERVVNALGASLLVLVTFALGSRLWGQRAGLLSAAVIATTPRLVLIAQKSIIDTYFTLFVTAALSLFCFIILLEDKTPPAPISRTTHRAGAAETESGRFPSPKHRHVFVALFYLALGLGVLTKGPLALVLAGGVIAIFVLTTRRWDLLRRMNLGLGIVILAGLILPWYVALYLKLGWDPIIAFIFRENLDRFASDIDWSSRGPFYYVSVLLGDFFPWSLFLIPAGMLCYQTWRQREAGQRLAALLVIWIGFIIVFFSIAHNKQEYYILPVYPAAAILIGWLFSRLMDGAALQQVRRGAQLVTWVAGIALTAAGIFLVLIGTELFPSTLAPILSLILVGGGFWILGQAWQKSLERVPTSLVALMLASVFLIKLVYLPLAENYRPIKALCRVIEREADSEDLVGTYNYAAPSVTFYLRRRIFEVFHSEQIQEILQSGQRVFCLMTESDFHELDDVYPGRLAVLDRRPLLTLRLNALWNQRARGDMPTLLLVSNR